MTQFNGLFWFALTLLPLAFLQRLLHREVQVIILILSRSPTFTITLFSLLFLPGVFLHEFSHYLMALILGVHTARFSLIPRMLPGGRLLLGYVETAKTDIVRDSLIGAAPLFAGGVVVAYIAISRLGLLPLWDVLRHGQWNLFWYGVSLLPRLKDFPLWFYLAFTVSSTMLPSQADRYAWQPLGLGGLILVGPALLAGAGPWMLTNIAPPLNSFLNAGAVIIGLSAVLHGVLVLPIVMVHWLAARATGMDISG